MMGVVMMMDYYARMRFLQSIQRQWGSSLSSVVVEPKPDRVWATMPVSRVAEGGGGFQIWTSLYPLLPWSATKIFLVFPPASTSAPAPFEAHS